MRNFIYIMRIVFLGMILNSCEQMVTNVDVPEYTPKLVVFSYISPADTLITVRVSKSKAVFGVNNNYASDIVGDATVIISDGVTSRSIPFVENYNGYTAESYIISQHDYAIVEGKKYTLEVSSPG